MGGLDPYLLFFLKGLLIGFSIAAPVGAIGVLCIRRTLAEGRAAGFFSGLGAATADAFYGAVAGFGLTFISGVMISQRLWIQSLGGLFLLYLGARTFLARPAPAFLEGKPHNHGNLVGYYLSTVALTITNPMTILSFAAVFAGLGVMGTEADYGFATSLVLGVFFGSAFWWLILSGGVGILRSRLNSAALRWVNRISGTIISGFGLLSLLTLIR